MSRVPQSAGWCICGALRVRGSVCKASVLPTPSLGVDGASLAHSSPVEAASALHLPCAIADRRTHTAQYCAFPSLHRFSSHMQVPVPAMARRCYPSWYGPRLFYFLLA
jgi:hypothetical protein